MRVGWLLLVGLLAMARAEPPVTAEPPAEVPLPRLPETRALDPARGPAGWILERHTLPLVHLEVAWLRDTPAHTPGDLLLHLFAGGLLDQGTRHTSADALAESLDLMGASFSSVATWDRTWAETTLPREDWRSALALLAEVVVRPRFPRRAVNRARRQWLRAYDLAPRSPGRLLARAALQATHPPDHPLGRMPDRTDYRHLRRRHLRSAWRAMREQGRLVVVVAGDVDPAAAQAAVAEHLPLAAGQGAPAAFSPVSSPPPRVVLVNDPGASQTRIRLSLPGPDAESTPRAGSTPEDRAVGRLVTQALGGDFTSRLPQRLREQEGLVYDVSAILRRQAGTTRIRIDTRVATPRTGRAVAALAEELRAMAHLSADELLRARRTLLREAAEELETLAGVSGRLVQLAIRGEGPEDWQAELEAIRHASLEEVREAAARLCDPDRATWILVGDRPGVEPQLEQVGRFPTHLWSAERAAWGPQD